MPFWINDRVIEKIRKSKLNFILVQTTKWFCIPFDYLVFHEIVGRFQSRSEKVWLKMLMKWRQILNIIDSYTLNETKQSQQLHFFLPRIRSRIFTLYSHFIFCDLIFLSLSHCCFLIKFLFVFWLCGDSCSWNNLEKQEEISKLFLYLYVWEYICMNAIMCTWPILENTMCKNCCFYVESWYCKK